jgi:hypothetical protein
MNQEIVKYLQEGKRRGFTIDRLKQELLKNGFDAKLVDESIAIVEGRGMPQTAPLNQMNSQQQMQTKQMHHVSAPIQSHQVSSQPVSQQTQPNIVKDHSKLLNSQTEERKSHKGLIITLVIILILLIGGGVAAWIFRDNLLSYFGL